MTTKSFTLADIIARMDLLTNAILSNKSTFVMEEAAAYLGCSPAYLYQLTSKQQIPHYKPSGGRLYFDRVELESWMRRNKVKTTSEIDSEAASHVKAGV